MKWTEHMCVDAHDTDFTETARPASLLRYMQTAANMQLRRLGPSNEELLNGGQAFVLSRIAITFRRPAHAYEMLDVSSWADAGRGYSFPRYYTIMRGDECIAEAASVWALIDVETRRPLRTTEYRPNFDYDAPITPDAPLRFALPQEMPACGTHRVTYSEVDFNMHMNNTRYLDMLTDCMNMRENEIRDVSIAFLSEAPYDSVLTIEKKAENGVTFFRTIREDGRINIEALIRTVSRQK